MKGLLARIDTSTTLMTAANTSTATIIQGQAVDFHATVTSEAGDVPTGEVELSHDSHGHPVILAPRKLLDGGTATVNVLGLNEGTYQVRATYIPGSAPFQGSMSAEPVYVTVTPAPPGYLAALPTGLTPEWSAKMPTTLPQGRRPTIPSWMRTFQYPGYTNVYSLDRLQHEPKLFGTETLFGDWDAPTLLYAKDAAPARVIRGLVETGDPNPWRHAVRNRDQMGYQTNEKVKEIARHFIGSKLYGSALAHMLKEAEDTSGSLPDLLNEGGELHKHLKRVLEFVVQNMPNLRAIICLGNDAHGFVASCASGSTAPGVPVGGCAEIELFNRRVLLGRLYHPSRAFRGGWPARHKEWQVVARQVNERTAV
jgi:hypothetical protein